MTTTQKKPGAGSMTVDKAVDLLEEIATAPEGVRNLDVARRLGLDKSTSHRLLSTLVRRGFVHREPHTKRFVLGPRLLQLATGSAISSILLARPFLYELVALTSESAAFSLLVDRTYVCVDAVQAPHEIRFALELGRPYPLNAGATGKVLLAFNERASQRMFSGELPKYAQYTVVAHDELAAQLDEIRRVGVACSKGERVSGGCSIAAPVIGRDGQALAAIAVSSVAARLGLAALRDHTTRIRALAAELSEVLARPDNRPSEER